MRKANKRKLVMYFLRVDLLPKDGGPLTRVRSVYHSLEDALNALSDLCVHNVILVRLELCN